jgi:hypothetical protein
MQSLLNVKTQKCRTHFLFVRKQTNRFEECTVNTKKLAHGYFS